MLTEALREAQSQNKDLSRQVQELTTIRLQLQNERDGLSAELSDTKDALKDAQARLEAANAALTQLRTDMEHRLREKDDEIDNIRLVFIPLHASSLSSSSSSSSSSLSSSCRNLNPIFASYFLVTMTSPRYSMTEMSAS